MQLKCFASSTGEDYTTFPFAKCMIWLGRQNQHTRNMRESCKGVCNSLLTLWNIQNCPDTTFWHLLLTSSNSSFLCSSPFPWVFLSNLPGSQNIYSPCHHIWPQVCIYWIQDAVDYKIYDYFCTTMKKSCQLNYITLLSFNFKF